MVSICRFLTVTVGEKNLNTQYIRLDMLAVIRTKHSPLVAEVHSISSISLRKTPSFCTSGFCFMAILVFSASMSLSAKITSSVLLTEAYLIFMNH